MKKIFKPASLLFSFLAVLVLFIVGIYFAGLIDAGRNQGLAGGAIVLGWGVLFAGAALFISFFATYKLAHKKVVLGNWILLLLLLISYGITHYRYNQRQKLKEEIDKPFKEKPTLPTTPAEPTAMLSLVEISDEGDIPSNSKENASGMGFFTPEDDSGEVKYIA